MRRAAPKPENFDELSRTWNNPVAHAQELNRYYQQLAAESFQARDITEPLHGLDPAEEHAI